MQQIRLALRRFEREQKLVAGSARHSLDSQMRDALTSILLYAQLALKSQDLPAEAAAHLNSILAAADLIRSHMGVISEHKTAGGESS